MNQDKTCEYGLHPQALIECRRRTFWVSFILDVRAHNPGIDRLDTYADIQVAISNFLFGIICNHLIRISIDRLPCREETYRAQQYATTPYLQTIFNRPIVFVEDDRPALSHMAYLIQILTWEDEPLNILRLARTGLDSSFRLTEEFYTDIIQWADNWSRNLPQYFKFSAADLG